MPTTDGTSCIFTFFQSMVPRYSPVQTEDTLYARKPLMKKKVGIRKSIITVMAVPFGTSPLKLIPKTWYITTSSIVKPRRASSHSRRSPPADFPPGGGRVGLDDFDNSVAITKFYDLKILRFKDFSAWQGGVSITLTHSLLHCCV